LSEENLPFAEGKLHVKHNSENGAERKKMSKYFIEILQHMQKIQLEA
jgi:hypothetical protein